MGRKARVAAASSAAAVAFMLPIAALSSAHAQPVGGLYVGGGGGLNLLQTSDVNAANGISGEVEFQPGAVGLLSLGWGFGNGLRAEVEGSYRWNRIDDGRSAALGPLTLFRGSQQSWAAMVNLLYDFAAFGNAPIVPYLGLGVGYAWTEAHKARATTTGLGLANVRIAADDWDANFAYQGIAGLAFNVPVPGLALTAEYRFFGTLSPEYQVRSFNLAGRAPVGRSTVETDNHNHSVLVGLRYAFNPPRRAAPAAGEAPAVQPTASTYMVFFDWDRADLTARARETIGQAAGASRSQQTTRLDVAGHADRSGTPQYNQGLSQRRADNVAAELVRQGVPRNAIVVTAFGESRPLVPTADGVREPQNRRVEIVLR